MVPIPCFITKYSVEISSSHNCPTFSLSILEFIVFNFFAFKFLWIIYDFQTKQ